MAGPWTPLTRAEVGDLYRHMLRLRRLAERAVVGPAWRGIESIPAGVVVAAGPLDVLVVDGDAAGALAHLRPLSAARRPGSTRARDLLLTAGPEDVTQAGAVAVVAVASPGLPAEHLHALLDRLSHSGGPAVLVLPPRSRGMPALPAADGRADRPADEPVESLSAACAGIDGLDAVAMCRAVAGALGAARASGSLVLVEPLLLDPDLAVAAASGVHDPHCDPIERLHAWGRDQGLLDQCDCARLERAVDAEAASIHAR